MKDSVYLVDVFGLIFRSYFAFISKPLTNPAGQNVSAFYGFFKTIFGLIRDRKPTHLALVYDSKGKTFRHDLFPDYKAHRDAAPEDLLSQIPLIEEAVRALNLPIVQKDGFEADDLLATLGLACRKEDVDCYIVSADKDLMQLVGGSLKMIRSDKGQYLIIDEAQVLEDKGVHPHQIADYLALLGDASDNIPGVKGIGQKTAEKLLQEWGSLEGIYQNLGSVSPPGVQKKLEEGRDSAYLSLRLTLLDGTAPLEQSWNDLQWVLESPEAGLAIFQKHNLKTLVDDLAKLSGLAKAPAGHPQGAPSAPGEAPSVSRGQYRWITDVKELTTLLGQARESGRVSFDLETDGLDFQKAQIVGVSFAFRPGEGFYVPFRGPEPAPQGGWADWEACRPLFQSLLQDPKVLVIGQNFKFDWKILRQWGVDPGVIGFDTMVAAWLLDTSVGIYNMDDLALKYLDYRTVTFDQVVGKGQTFADVELEKAADYAAEDADITLRLYEVLSAGLKARGFEKLFYELEMPVLNILCQMEETGIRLRGEELETYSVELGRLIGDVEQQIYTLCGHAFNIASPKQLQEVLFEERQLKTGKKTKTGFSTDSSVLEELAREDPVVKLVLRFRALTKLKSTYVDTLPLLVNEKTGRVHTHYIITGTATGRLACKDPNLQNIPIRDEEGRRIRKSFVPQDGWTFVSADYSQVELVLLAHLSGDKNLCRAFLEGQDIHTRTASLIYGIPEEMVTSDLRRVAKTINFGIMYGMSAFRLSNELGIPRSHASQFIESYFREFSGIREFIEATLTQARADGFVTTLLGRSRPLTTINSKNGVERSSTERIAVNTPIQGSGADLIKLAMIGVAKALKEKKLKSRLLLQVHDELLLECPQDEVEQVKALMKEVMEGVYTLQVPLRVSVEGGQTWGDLH